MSDTVRSPSYWDVLVIGSGPAGVAAAIAARSANPSASVLLLDRSEFPRDKCCGDAVLHEGISELARHGVPPQDLLQGYVSTRSLRLITGTRRTVMGRLPVELTVIPRKVFDARLLAAARTAGAVWQHRRVRTVLDRGSHVDVDSDLRAGVVIGADGAESIVRRCIHPPKARHLAIALRGYTRCGPADTPVMAFEPGGGLSYAWSFPSSDGAANVGFGHLIRPGRHPDRATLLHGLHRLMPHARPDPASLRAARLPLSSSRQPVADGRILLCGDAAALVNPLSGEGIYYAISSGLAAGHAAATAPVHAATSYRRTLRRRFAVHQTHASVMASLASSGRVLEAGLLAVGANPLLFTDLAALGLAEGRISGRLMRGLLAQLVSSTAQQMPLIARSR